MSESELFLRTFVPVPGYDVWIRVVFEDIRPCPWLWCLNQSGFWGHLSLPQAMVSESELFLGHLSLPLAVMSESECFFRTFVPVPGYDVWIRVVFRTFVTAPGCDVWIRVVFWGHSSLPLAKISQSALFLRTFVPVPGYDVWIRVVFEDICPCPWLWCLNQSCFLGHLSLSLAVMSESELFLRTFVL